MRRILACTTVGLAAVACSSFGSTDTSGGDAGSPDAATTSATEAGVEPGGPTDGGILCPGTHLFCADFDTLSLGAFPSSEASADGRVQLEALAAAAYEGGGGLRVTVPNTDVTLYNHLDADFSGQAGNTITYAFWLRIGTVNASTSAVEIADIVWGGGDAGLPVAIILEHSQGKLRLSYERSSAPVTATTAIAVTPGAWQHVAITLSSLKGKPTMKLEVDQQATAGAPLVPATPFVGDIGIELGAGYVNAPCPPTAYDIDDVTLDSN